MKIKGLLIFLFVMILMGIQPMPAQTAYQGFNKLHYEQLLRTRSCPGCMLYYARLSGIDLSGANLRGASLIGATMRNATLRNVNFYGARIKGIDFSGADLSGATWSDGRVCGEGSIGYCKTGQN